MIAVPESPSNADFGGKDMRTLYITARTSVYAVATEVKGHRFGARARASSGPDQGALVIVGGGAIGPEIVARFVALAGGPESEFVVIPTATETENVDTKRAGDRFARLFGVKNVTVLHTRDRAEADTEAVRRPAQEGEGGLVRRRPPVAAGRLVPQHAHPARARGRPGAGWGDRRLVGGGHDPGLIPGPGAREGNHIMMAKGYEQGFGHLKDVAIDQHIIPRHREQDLVAVIEAHPELLGLGIDEATAVVVQGDRFEVIGKSVVGIYDGADHDGKRVLLPEQG